MNTYKLQAMKTTNNGGYKPGARMLGIEEDPKEVACIYMDVPDTGATIKQCNSFAPEIILDGDIFTKQVLSSIPPD
jgi:hypothetical protein